MKANIKNYGALVVLLCVAMILAYASSVFLPHVHECVEDNCTLCAMLENLRGSQLCAVLSLAVACLAGIYSLAVLAYMPSLSARERTPVGLKVKLSN